MTGGGGVVLGLEVAGGDADEFLEPVADLDVVVVGVVARRYDERFRQLREQTRTVSEQFASPALRIAGPLSVDR